MKDNLKPSPIVSPRGAKPSNKQDKLDSHRGTKKSAPDPIGK